MFANTSGEHLDAPAGLETVSPVSCMSCSKYNEFMMMFGVFRCF